MNAENLKNDGNELYKQKKYQEALEMYSQAIRLLPSCAAYYGNRSATYMMLNKFHDALEDAKQATTIDKEFTKVSSDDIYELWMMTSASFTTIRKQVVLVVDDPVSTLYKNKVCHKICRAKT